MFLLNHPSLLNYTEKYGLHALVDQVIKRLDNTEYVEVTDWLKYELGEAWYHLVRGSAIFYRTYCHNSVSRYQVGF